MTSEIDTGATRDHSIKFRLELHKPYILILKNYNDVL